MTNLAVVKKGSVVMLTAIVMILGGRRIHAQQTSPFPQISKQIAAPLPRVALVRGGPVVKGKTQYHRITLAITNRDKYDLQMFSLQDGMQLLPDPCGVTSTRVISAIYDERGTAIAKCMPVAGRESLGEINFLLAKGAAVPRFVYIVLTDLGTGGAYRSNLISPLTGAVK